MKRFGRLDLSVMKSDLRASDKVVAAALGMFLNAKTGQCNPSLSTLGDATNMKRSNVSTAVHRLISAGFITMEKHPDYGRNYALSLYPDKPQLLSPDKPQLSSPDNSLLSPDNGAVIKREVLSSSIDKTIEKTTDNNILALPTAIRSDHQADAAELLLEWNERLPKTCPGVNQLLDQNAIITLLCEHSKTPDDIRAYLAFIEQEGKAPYWPRPSSLLRHTGGSGSFVFAHIETAMEAQNARPLGINQPATPEQRGHDFNELWQGEFGGYGVNGPSTVVADARRIEGRS